MVDRVRFSRDSNPEKFDAAMQEFYKRYPDQIASPPGKPTEDVQLRDSTKFEKTIAPPKRNQR